LQFSSSQVLRAGAIQALLAIDVLIPEIPLFGMSMPHLSMQMPLAFPFVAPEVALHDRSAGGIFASSFDAD
jgi:hypothetical protein